MTLIEAGADRERVGDPSQNLVLTCQTNVDGEVPEEIDGVGGQEQKNVRAYVVSKVGIRDSLD